MRLVIFIMLVANYISQWYTLFQDLCQGENEDLRHFLLKCTGLSDIRKRILALQQPYNEDEDEVIMMFLFEEDRRKMEERKTDLYSMWKLRKRKQRELNTT